MNTRSTLAVLLSGILLFTACVPSLPFLSDDEEEVVVARPVTTIERPTVTVERGAIIDAVRVLGRVVAESEESLFFKQNGRLKGIYIQYNQPVVAGTLLADLEIGALETQIENSELSLEDLQRNLTKARSQAASSQADVTLAELAVEQAERDLEKAQEALTITQGGPTDIQSAQARTTFAKAETDLLLAENQLEEARTAYEKAQQDVRNYQSGAPVDLRTERQLALSEAEQAVNAAETRVSQLQSGGADTGVLNAKNKLADAENAVDLERAKLLNEIDQQNQRVTDAKNRLEQAKRDYGEDSDQYRDEVKRLADIEEQVRWETNIRLCQLVITPEPGCFEIVDGRVTDNRVMVLEPLPNTEMARKWNAQEVARIEYALAQAQSANPLGEAQATLDQARFNLEQARQALNSVEEDLARVLDGAEVALMAAEAAVDKAKADLDVAREAWEVVQSGVDDDAVREAQLLVATREANLVKVKANLEQALINAADAGNVAKLENDLKRSRANHALLLEQLADSRLVAPFDGVIQFIQGKAGETVSAYGPIIGLADPSKLIITADLSEDDSAKVALEQTADLTLDAFPSVVLQGVITKLPTSLVTTQGIVQDRSIRIEVDWPQDGAEIGMLARVTITVQHKDDVLKVPIESVKRSGRRTFVEFMDGDIKRAKNVEIGIQTETEVEILSGLEEGFVILQGQ